MSSPRTTTSYAILGLLGVRSWTTYELTKQVRRSLHWFWPRAERKLYDEPKRLVADGLATASRESTGKRPRTVYRITPAGRDAMTQWLDEPAAARTTEFAGMLKVFFADAGSLEQLGRTLEAIEEESVARLEALCAMAAAGAEEPVFPRRAHLSALCLRLQLEQEQAVLGWADWALAQVARWEATDDPGGWDPARELRRLAAEGQQAVRSHAPRGTMGS